MENFLLQLERREEKMFSAVDELMPGRKSERNCRLCCLIFCLYREVFIDLCTAIVNSLLENVVGILESVGEWESYCEFDFKLRQISA